MAADIMARPSTEWIPRPHQVPPPAPWNFDFWFLKAGRGAGKTDAASHFFDRHMSGPACLPGVPGGHRGAIIAPTLGDSRETCIKGVSGLMAANGAIRYNENRGVATWPNGAEARIFGAYGPEEPERLRGPQHCILWAEEIAAWKRLEAVWDMAMFGLRLGPHPIGVLTSTPKPRPKIRALLSDPRVHVTEGTTDDNPHLAASVRAELYTRYGGTRLGRQELAGELLLDVPGALWQADWIEANRVMVAPEMARVIIAVDPAATSGEDADETAICAAGKGVDGQFYVWSCNGYHLSPKGWATKALDEYDARKGDLIVAEVNNGGEMVVSTLRSVRTGANVKSISASRGKTLRAEPVAALYEQGRVHHVGKPEPFAVLEDQMTTFPVANEHDDRVDALVYALTELNTSPGLSDYFRSEADRLRILREKTKG
jgi:predicted phage terminase large subunit-like protein